jgi:lipoprotein Spr
VESDYAQRGGDPDRLGKTLSAAGLLRIDAASPGDLIVMQTGPAQYHLGIATADGMVHADARLRRVVETPGPPRWPVMSIWRAREDG